MGYARQIRILVAIVAFGVGLLAAVPTAQAATAHTMTFVNRTGGTVWIGSSVNADGSARIGNLPKLADGASGTVTIPDNTGPRHWRGTFFARQGCTGTSGSTFTCRVGDCGPFADRCSTGQRPVSLAEFNFDAADRGAPWYDVSYVDAVSVPVTIVPIGAPPASGACGVAGCPGALLSACPAANLKRDPAGKPMLCVNPNRDAPTAYSRAVSGRCPRAYAWSKQDTEPGNQTVHNCPGCRGMTVTFNRA